MFGRKNKSDYDAVDRPGAPMPSSGPPAKAHAARSASARSAGTVQLDRPAAPINASDDLGMDPEPLWSPVAPAPRKTVEALLLERGDITEEQLTQALQVRSATPGKSMAQVLLTMSVVSDSQILSALAETLGLPFESPDRAAIQPEAFAILPPDYIRKRLVLPARFVDGKLLVLLADPTNVFLIDEVKRKGRRDIRIGVTTAGDINRVVELMTSSTADLKVEEIIKDMAEDGVQIVQDTKDDVTDLAKIGSESPIIRFVNYLIHDAIKQSASDIHIEPKEKALKIRYRIDGVLFDAMSPPYTMTPAVISRLKIMANLDISERRLPQDGRIRAVIHDRKVDLRMSTLPTADGEKVVIRILDNRSINVPLEDLGFSEDNLTIWKTQIEQPHGIILVTGPTGSGKTTTLYSSLRCMDGAKLNISTVEDPIEYQLAQASQVQVHEKINMSFSVALRALLRQDPDVIMLGEIRDAETARIAVQASLTGHLVLSTMHTNDAPASITRLINVGVEPYLISAAVNAILAQRLVRKICPTCREPFVPSDEMQEFLALQGMAARQTFKGRGCDRCRKTGYQGRLGIYELLVMDDSMRDMVTRNPDVTQLRKLCRERGLVPLREDGLQKVLKGLTTVDEILRVTSNAA